MTKTRLDALLVDRGLVSDPDMAQRLLMAGQVRVNGQMILNPATKVDTTVTLDLDRGRRFVSRGGEKLEAGLQAFRLEIEDRVCADVGASTGGFTDCLLQHGARRVYTIDVGHGILDWKLRSNPRVIVYEDTNARFIDRLPEPVSLVTIDASFISLKVILPVVKDWLSSPGDVIALIKPQFEAGKEQSARARGVIRDQRVHRIVLDDLLAFSQQTGYDAQAIIRSPLIGPKGNIEFLTWLRSPAQMPQDVHNLVAGLFEGSGGPD